MYEYLIRGKVSADGDQSPEAVSHHRGSCQDFLNRHKEDVNRALQNGLRGVKEIAPYLFHRIADARTMRLGWDFLALKGGQAPGPNRHLYADYTSAEVWGLCRCLADAVRNSTYRPGPERVVWIDKTSGGQRPIVLLDIEDRVVQRAVVLILQPVLDPLFDSRCSFGYRPKLGHLHALALAEWLTLSQRRRFWVAEDIKDAFLHVPLGRLLQVVEKLLPANDLLDLLERVLPGQSLPGVRQGGPLSPLMLNVYLHHFLDRPWRRDHPRLPMVRVADDLLALCRSEGQAQEAHGAFRRLLLPAGMPLKETERTSIYNLDAGESVQWLGFTVRKAQRGLAAEVAQRSWKRLNSHLDLAHTKSDAPLRATHTIKQWLNQRGPCYPWSDREEVCQKIVAVAQEHAFEEVPGPHDLRQLWQRAFARWCKLRKEVRTTYQSTGAMRCR